MTSIPRALHLDNRRSREAWSGYFGGPPGSAGIAPYAVPARRTDEAGLPPAFLGWTANELSAEENRAYAYALKNAGVPVTVGVVAGGDHGFENWAGNTVVAELIARAQMWLRQVTAYT